MMNELLEKGLGLFPAYFKDLIALTTGPKRFVAKRLSEDSQFEKAFIFLGISYGFGFILKASMVQQDLWVELGTGAAFTLVQAVAYGSAIWAAWRAVGGSGTLAGTLVVSIYYTAVIEFILVFSFLGLLGTIRTADPLLYTELLTSVRNGTMLQFALQTDRLMSSLGMRLALLGVLPLTLLVFAVWLIAGWGAYRSQHRVPRVRSIPAFLLFGFFCVPVAAATFIVANALIR